MYFQRLFKDEWNGFAYEDMGLDGFDVASEDGTILSEEQRKKKADTRRNAERRRTRTHVAAALINGDLFAKRVMLTANHPNGAETVDVLVVGSTADVKAIPDNWSVEMERWRLGSSYETTYGWMTLKNDAPLMILRSSDENAEKRLNAFLADAIRFIKRMEESEAA